MSFLERLTESRETVSILSLQPPRSWQEPQEHDAAQVNRRYAPKQGMMTEKTAGKRMISRDRHKGSGDIRVTEQVSLPLLSLRENRVQPQGSGKEKAGIWREKVPYQMGAVLQRTISDPHEDGSRRRCRPGRVMPALYPSGSVQNAPLQTDSGSLHFRSFKRLEQEIDVIRKTMADTREALSEQSRSPWMPAADTLKSVTDLNLLSDHVYRELERRIRAERERRGI